MEIGSILRHRRQELNLTLEEVAEQTKIRKSYILALEEENFEELPGKVYIVGFLKNYARVLGLAVEPLLETLHESVGTVRKTEGSAAQIRPQYVLSAKKAPLRILPWIVLAVAVLVAAGIFFLSQLIGKPRSTSEGEVPQVLRPEVASDPADDAAATGTLGPVETPSPASESDGNAPVSEKESVPLVIPPGGGTLKLIVEGNGTFLVSIDGGSAREYVAQPGLTLSWPVKEAGQLDLDIEGRVLLQLDDQQIAVTGQRHVRLISIQEQKD